MFNRALPFALALSALPLAGFAQSQCGTPLAQFRDGLVADETDDRRCRHDRVGCTMRHGCVTAHAVDGDVKNVGKVLSTDEIKQLLS